VHKSNLYELYFWPDDPSSERGQKYLQETFYYFQKLIDSSIISSNFLDKDEWNVLEICAGSGYGSLVFASLFPNKKVNVLVTDTRDLFMENARLSAILGINNVNFRQIEAMQISDFNKKFDVIIMYGLSTPHFPPKESIQLYSKVKEALSVDGFFILQEMDRRKALFLDGKYYKKAYAEGHNERLVSEEIGYNVDDGTVQREYYSEKDPSSRVSSKSFFWSVAETDALLSLYWDKVDKVPLGGDKYFLISSEPLNK
jgi:SAM-dependent methyltransferase